MGMKANCNTMTWRGLAAVAVIFMGAFFLCSCEKKKSQPSNYQRSTYSNQGNYYPRNNSKRNNENWGPSREDAAKIAGPASGIKGKSGILFRIIALGLLIWVAIKEGWVWLLLLGLIVIAFFSRSGEEDEKEQPRRRRLP